MKITEVRTTPLLVPYTKPYYWAQGRIDGACVILVEVLTDEDITGYGECISDLDVDPTDTTLVDTAIPLPGGNGFSYLVSWVDLDGEGGLGATSAGMPREVALPCP